MPACSSGTLTNVLPHRNAMSQTGHDTPPHHSIQTQGRPVAVLSIDVERHTGIHNYPSLSLVSDPNGKSFPDLPHTTAKAQLSIAGDILHGAHQHAAGQWLLPGAGVGLRATLYPPATDHPRHTRQVSNNTVTIYINTD